MSVNDNNMLVVVCTQMTLFSVHLHKIIWKYIDFCIFIFPQCFNVSFNCPGSYGVKKYSLSNCVCFTNNLLQKNFYGYQSCLFYKIMFLRIDSDWQKVKKLVQSSVCLAVISSIKIGHLSQLETITKGTNSTPQ